MMVVHLNLWELAALLAGAGVLLLAITAFLWSRRPPPDDPDGPDPDETVPFKR